MNEPYLDASSHGPDRGRTAHDEPYGARQPGRSRAGTAKRRTLLVATTFLLGLGGGYLLWGGAPGSAASLASSDEESARRSQQATNERLLLQVNPQEGYALPLGFGNLGPQLLAAGAIDYDRFVQLYERAGKPLTEAQRAVLNGRVDDPIVIDKQNAYFLLNFFWALGLTNQNAILTEGPMTKYGEDQIGRFASTGGWTVGAKPATELYSSAPIVPLTPAQQARLERVAQGVYRPCCNNSTYFPDCNHGMAMLGLLTHLASQDATEAEMFEAAKYANAFWYPQQNLELAVYFQNTTGQDFSDVDAEQIVSRDFSSGAGFQAVHQSLVSRGVLQQAPSAGSGCSV